MKFFGKNIIKEDNKSESDRRAIYDMIQSPGWKITFGKMKEVLRDIKDIRNIPDKDIAVEVKARQLLINMLNAHYEEIYGIVVNNENVNDEDEGSETYKALSGSELASDEEEF